MDKLASRTFLLCLLLTVFTKTRGQQCQEIGWFGDKCQYQCHCHNNAVCDKTTGDCPDVCDKGWFGPQCQYRDAAFSNNRIALTDGDDSTCLVGPDLTQEFPLLDDVMFTWMKIVTNKPGLFGLVNMTFNSSTGAEVAPKSSLRKVYVSDTILELHGEFQDRIKSIKLHFDTQGSRESFCTMQVSSGRNVAIKQKASQTSTWLGRAEKAVDGKSSLLWNGGICSSTEQDDNPYWTLDLSLPVAVNMYTLIGATDSWVLCRLRHFRLESYFQSTQVQRYDKTGTVDLYNYVYSEDTSPITSVTLTVSRDRWPNNYIHCNNDRISLSFCEMQIFGDVVCQPGKWGRDCMKDCNCQEPSESCLISTGMCTSGCKPGFHGPGCQEACDPGSYGYNCNKACPTNCLNNICDNVDGTCTQCVAGYQGPKCEQECDSGLYSYNCNKACPTNCLNNKCDNVDGTCTQCVAGYQGPKCEQECNPTYYGQGCSTLCSDKCKDQFCHHISGQCDDCPDGIQLSENCSKECDLGFHGYNCIYSCPENCRNKTCNKVDGLCIECEAGYQGPLCGQECDAGVFGYNCNEMCPTNCLNNTCDNVDGTCTQCVAGYQGPKCEQDQNQESTTTTTPAPTVSQAPEPCHLTDTDWSHCSATCDMGISMKFVIDRATCSANQRQKLCFLRPCDNTTIPIKSRRDNKCTPTSRSAYRVPIQYQDCTSYKSYILRFCNTCKTNKCCWPVRTRSFEVKFRCPDRTTMTYEFLRILKCRWDKECYVKSPRRRKGGLGRRVGRRSRDRGDRRLNRWQPIRERDHFDLKR